MSNRTFLALAAFILWMVFSPLSTRLVAQNEVPLPEHPRPDWERSRWLNLNGDWQFQFDSLDRGLQERWQDGSVPFEQTIAVPFPWGAPLSGVKDEADIGWYARTVRVPADWEGTRIFLVIGAADWRTSAWLDGMKLGEHQGGYTPFEFDLTPHVKPGVPQQLVIRVDDTSHPFKLEGKQGYGPARGIWQTPYLEARGEEYLDMVHFTPDIENGMVGVDVRLADPAPEELPLRLRIGGERAPVNVRRNIPAGEKRLQFEVSIPQPHLWSLEDPFLYEVEVLLGEGTESDKVHTYFGMRSISVVDLPGAQHRYVALNGEPVYLQMALDQAYHPEGFYTFPSDEFIRNEVLRSRRIGLNGMRVHVKVGIPRKLYWADRLGMLIMADVPNSWGEPGAQMKREAEYAMRQMIRRDYNHPSIFSWVIFNETWGLFTQDESDDENRRYLPETQEWVVEMYREAKRLDPTRLVEDNSVCCGIGHTETDLNTWHSYLPGWAWEEALSRVDSGTFEGSTWNFEEGFAQDRQPNLNSEFGNVWGYQGSTGDVDWSWDYHRALNVFRRYPSIAGWLYTEHHDVVNEWNGYWRYDRSEKETGMGALVEGMSLRDLHAPFYLSTGGDLSRSAAPGESVSVPLYASFLTGREDVGDTLLMRAEWYGWDALGRRHSFGQTIRPLAYEPWMTGALEPIDLVMPDEPAVVVLKLSLEDVTGRIWHRNFTTFVVEGTLSENALLDNGRRARLLRVRPNDFSGAEWTLKQWNVREGRKVNGAGAGYFEYEIPWPEDLTAGEVEAATFLVETSAKQLFGKDREDAGELGGDYMRGRGTFDPSRNPNAYPMTDEAQFPSAVHISFNGSDPLLYELPDDPADHRGILSWHHQLRDRKLREAGSYGYKLQVPISSAALQEAQKTGMLHVRLEVPEALPGGLAIYGAQFGRYPMDPTVVLTLR